MELRCSSTESKSSLWKLRCASEIKKIKLRILHCAFVKKIVVLCWAALLISCYRLFVPSSDIYSRCRPIVQCIGI